MVVLKDIADRAGVSIATASRALQNDSRISESTKEKVSAIADSLGYTKHKTKKQSKENWDTVGVIVPEVLSGYYAQLVHLANDNFARNKITTIIKITNFDQNAMIQHIKNFAKLRVKSLLILVDDSEEISEEILKVLSSNEMNVMLITAKYISGLDFDSIYIDEYSGIAMAIEHLVLKGYKRIGFIGEEHTAERYHAYEKKMRKLDMLIEEKYVKISQKRAEAGGYSCMRKLIDQADYPDAVLMGYDQMAIGAIFAIEEAGLRIPEDIAIVGFDDIHVSQYIHKGITTIKSPYEDMMSIAVRVLLKRTEYPNSAPQQIAIKPSIVIRGTT